MLSSVRGRAAQARAARLLGACALLLCAHLAWRGVARHPAPADRSDSIRPDVSLAAPSSAAPAPSASGDAASPRIELARRCLALADTDPLAAMESALAQNLTADDPGLLVTLVLRWASRDFDDALAWTKTQEAGAWRNDMLAHLAYLRAQTDPLAAARLVVANISPGRARDEAIVSVVHQWALRDPEAAAHWASSFDDETLRRRASAEVAALASSDTPQEARSR
jgi:hypothetical protein